MLKNRFNTFDWEREIRDNVQIDEFHWFAFVDAIVDVDKNNHIQVMQIDVKRWFAFDLQFVV